MLTKTTDNVYTSALLRSVPNLVHGYSSRRWGDMKKEVKNRTRFMDTLFPAPTALFMAEQVHGSGVTVLTEEERATNMVSGADALVYKVKPGKKVALGVVAADCVPLLLADPQAHVIATIHAGWKGVLGSIVPKTIGEMIKRGARAGHIIGVIGPHIGMCHYDVSKSRAGIFLKTFAADPKVASFFEGSWHLDLGFATLRQLLDAGITFGHIDAPITCTACQIDHFFSYRKDSKESFGEIMGVIGFS